jgi:hypothetical protein
LTGQQTQERADVVDQLQSHRLLVAVQLQDGRSLGRPGSRLFVGCSLLLSSTRRPSNRWPTSS